ncbi:MAG: DinB family protein [Gimesia sp.]
MLPSAEEIAREFIQESVHSLEQSLRKINHCLNQLDDDQLWWRPQPELNSIGNLILHMCGNLNQWAVCGIPGSQDERQREQEFHADARISRGELDSLLHTTLKQACQTFQSLSAELLLEPRQIQGFSMSVMGVISHTVPHFVGHTHQIIYITRLQKGTQYQFDWSPDSDQPGVPI